MATQLNLRPVGADTVPAPTRTRRERQADSRLRVRPRRAWYLPVKHATDFVLALLLSVVAQGAPRRLDTTRQGGVGNRSAVPDALHQLILGNHAGAVFDKVQEQIEHLGFDGDAGVLPADLPLGDIDNLGFDGVLHVPQPCVSG